jgi:F0F1-type ATP synthase epsilon subunit
MRLGRFDEGRGIDAQPFRMGAWRHSPRSEMLEAPPLIPMTRNTPRLNVTVSTPRGVVCSEQASAVDLRTADSCIHLTPAQEGFLCFLNTSHVTIRSGTSLMDLSLHNASASVRDGRLVIIAESAVFDGASSSGTLNPT